MKILITGIAGMIGSILAPDLERDHEVYGLDIRPSGRPLTSQVDLCDLARLAPVFQDIEVVIHLAADRRHEVEIGWEALMDPNVIATANMFEAAHAAGVRRVIFASSMHVMGGYEFDEPYRSIAAGQYAGLDPQAIKLVGGDDPVRPDSRYGASKIFGEALGRYYAEFGNIDRTDQRPMEVICVRLGTLSYDNRPGDNPRSWVSWFSNRDVAAFFRACVERPNLRYEIFYGASANTWKIYDTPYAWRVLGFSPADNAEGFREQS